MIVRKAEFGDIRKIVPFLLDAKEFVENDVPVDENTLRNTLQRVVNQPGNQLFISMDDDRITGVLAGISNQIWYSKKKQVLDLVFYVDPEYAGHGYYLARRYLGWARKVKGVAPGEVYLGVTSGMDIEKTSQFYERLGLSRAGAVYRMGNQNVESSQENR